MKFLHLTDVRGETVLVVPSAILVLRVAHPEYGHPEGSKASILLIDGSTIQVRDTPAEIEAMTKDDAP